MGFRCAGALVCAALTASCVARDAPASEALQIELVGDSDAILPPVSLTATDGTGMILRELQAKVVLDPPLAFTQLELAFQNPNSRRLEGRFQIALPDGGSISRLALQFGGHYEEGEVVARPKAVAAYEEALHARRDPALLEHDAGNEYRLRVFPIEALETKHVIVSYSQVVGDGDAAYRLPLLGLPRIDRVHVELSRAAGKRAPPPQVFERYAWQPTGDVAVRLPGQGGGRAVVSDDLVLMHVSPASECRPAPIERMTLLIDTSASAAPGFELRMKRLRALLTELNVQLGRAFPLQVTVFDQEFVPLLETRSDQLGPELEAQLRARGALGATDLDTALSGLARIANLGDRVLVYSDGIATAGAADRAALAQRVAALAAVGVKRLDVLTYGSVVDRGTLEALAHGDLPEAGVIASDRDPVSAAARMLRGTEPRVAVQVEGAEWTYPAELRGVEPDRAYAIFAKVRDSNTVELQAGNQRVALHPIKAGASALLDREWARARIEYLEHKLAGLSEPDATPVRDLIVELSVKHRVLSEPTAWVVLQSDADYGRHAITRSDAPLLQVQNGALIATREAQPVGAAPLAEPWLRDQPSRAARPPTPQPGRVLGMEGARASDDRHDAKGGGAGIIGVHRARGSGGAFTQDRFGLGALGTIGHSADGDAMAMGRGAGYDERAARVLIVRAMKANVRGPLSKEVVRRIVQRHINEVRFCYEQALNVRPWVEGLVAVKFVISEFGQLQTAALASSTLADARLEACIVEAVHRWTFPSPEAGGTVVVTQPFALFVSPSPDSSWAHSAYEQPSAAEQRRAARAAELEARARREGEWRDRPQPVIADALSGPMLDVFEAIQNADFDGALARARAYRADHPLDPMALLALARAAAASGDRVLAARAYGSLIDVFPSRAEWRRAAGQGLEDLGSDALALAIDSYRKAVALRPDQTSGRRMLAFALWRAGQPAAARKELDVARTEYVWSTGPAGGDRLLTQDLAAVASTQPSEMVQICLYWENDATDVDLSVYDGLHRHLGFKPQIEGDPVMLADVTNGFGPECLIVQGKQIAFPYVLQVQLAVSGPTGHAVGAVHIMQIDRNGHASFEMRPFVVMKPGAFVPLGDVRPPPA
jgi:hypothetical protein